MTSRRAVGGGGTPRRAPSRDPYGLVPGRGVIAPVLSLAGLLIIGVITLNLVNGQLPVVPGTGGGPGNGGDGDPITRTPTPSNIVVVPDDPRAEVPGTIVYVKDGNVWLQSGKSARQLTVGGRDSMASFGPDGLSVYFVRTEGMGGRWPAGGETRGYDLEVPSLWRVPVDAGSAERIINGRIVSGDRTWSAWIRQPSVSPDGATVAMATDLPDPTKSDVVIQLWDLETGKLSKPKLPETVPLGHQDPAWRPDGRVLLYVRNGRDGATGAPEIWTFTLSNQRTSALTNPGYLHPDWSRDGQWIVATRTTAFGTDVAILNNRGTEVLRLTTDGRSWAPVWSPRGDAIAFLHSSGEVVDLRMIAVERSGAGWVAGDALDLTELSGLDSVSRPDWFIPAADLPPLPTPSPTPTPTPAPTAVSPGPSSP